MDNVPSFCNILITNVTDLYTHSPSYYYKLQLHVQQPSMYAKPETANAVLGS